MTSSKTNRCHPSVSMGFARGTSGKEKKNPPANAGDIKDTGLILGLGRSPREGNGNPRQYSCLGNPKDRGAWQATVHGVAKSPTQLSDFTFTFFHKTYCKTTTFYIYFTITFSMVFRNVQAGLKSFNI